jgi:hypothetical protein
MQKKYFFLLSIQVLLIYALTLESVIFIFTNAKLKVLSVYTKVRVRNIETRVENHSEPPNIH